VRTVAVLGAQLAAAITPASHKEFLIARFDQALSALSQTVLSTSSRSIKSAERSVVIARSFNPRHEP
jgi:hypothetical protein